MRGRLMEHDGASVAAPTLGVQWPQSRSADTGVTGQIKGTAGSAADELGSDGVRLAALLSACIAVLATLGAVDALVTPLAPFNVDAELDFTRHLPDGLAAIAIFSGGLLFAASWFSARTAARLGLFPWAGIGAFLAFMGVDEMAGVHERIGHLVGTDWQTAYIPIVLVGGIFWLVVLRKMWTSPTQRLFWIGGAAAWFLAQCGEALVLHEPKGWTPLAGLDIEPGIEETLEMFGSMLFLLALYMVVRRDLAREPRLGRHHTGTQQHVELGA